MESPGTLSFSYFSQCSGNTFLLFDMHMSKQRALTWDRSPLLASCKGTILNLVLLIYAFSQISFLLDCFQWFFFLLAIYCLYFPMVLLLFFVSPTIFTSFCCISQYFFNLFFPQISQTLTPARLLLLPVKD